MLCGLSAEYNLLHKERIYVPNALHEVDIIGMLSLFGDESNTCFSSKSSECSSYNFTSLHSYNVKH